MVAQSKFIVTKIEINFVNQVQHLKLNLYVELNFNDISMMNDVSNHDPLMDGAFLYYTELPSLY